MSTHVVLRDQVPWQQGGLVLLSAALDVEWNLLLRIQVPVPPPPPPLVLPGGRPLP